MAIKFVLNETSYFGENARATLVEEIKKRGFKKVFLVSDKSLVEARVTSKVEKILKDAKIKYTLYDEIKPNPTIKNVTDGVEACKAAKADVIVAVGDVPCRFLFCAGVYGAQCHFSRYGSRTPDECDSAAKREVFI